MNQSQRQFASIQLHEQSSASRRPRAGRATRLALLTLALAAPGCSELVHEGVISDRETSRPIPTARIEQMRGGEWRELGETDGRGRWWIMKHDIKGGGRIKLSKPGYYADTLPESEFLGGQSFLLVPTGADSDDQRGDISGGNDRRNRSRNDDDLGTSPADN